MENPTPEMSLEVVRGDALNQITKAEVDCQISTAHAFPRSMDTFLKRATAMATIDESTAASCIYRRPVGRDDEEGGQKFVEGMSVRMAEIVATNYGNLRVASVIVEQTDRYVKARGFAHDLETNYASSSECVESTVKKNGQVYSERQRLLTAKVCLAKARRDAIFQVVPKAIARPVEIAAKKVAVGDEATMKDRIARVMDWLKSLKIDMKRIFGAINVNGEADIGLQQLELLTGLRTALKDGDITLEEAFPENYMPTGKADDQPKKIDSMAMKTVEQLQDFCEASNRTQEDLLAFFRKAGLVDAKNLIEVPPEVLRKMISSEWVEKISAAWKESPATAPSETHTDPEGSQPDPEGFKIRGTLTKVEITKGKKRNGTEWTRFKLNINDQWCGTFDTKLGEKSQALEGKQVEATCKEGYQKKAELIAIEEINNK